MRARGEREDYESTEKSTPEVASRLENRGR